METDVYPNPGLEEPPPLSEEEFVEIAKFLGDMNKKVGDAIVIEHPLPKSVGLRSLELVTILNDSVREQLYPGLPKEKGLAATVRDVIKAGELMDKLHTEVGPGGTISPTT